MAKQTWICEKCNTQYSTQTEAETCEGSHIDLGKAELVRLIYGQRKEGNKNPSKYPLSIVVRFLDDPDKAVAEYSMIHLGLGVSHD